MPGLADIQGMTTGQQIADKYRYSAYGDLFDPLNPQLREQSKDGYWEENYGAPMYQSAGNRFNTSVGGAQEGFHNTALQNILSKYSSQSQSGFAGSGAINRQASLGSMANKNNYNQQYSGLKDAYGREQFGIGQDVINKQGQTQSAIDSWYRGILDQLDALQARDATKDPVDPVGGGGAGSGGGNGGITNQVRKPKDFLNYLGGNWKDFWGEAKDVWGWPDVESPGGGSTNTKPPDGHFTQPGSGGVPSSFSLGGGTNQTGGYGTGGWFNEDGTFTGVNLTQEQWQSMTDSEKTAWNTWTSSSGSSSGNNGLGGTMPNPFN